MTEWQNVSGDTLQALGRMAGGVAHDFNNILSIIEGYAYQLQNQQLDAQSLQEVAQAMLAATQRGAGLTHQLLAFGRQSNRDTQVSDLAQEIYNHDMLLRSFLGSSHGVEVEVPTDVTFPVGLSHDAIWQILMNLVSNARDAMKHGGKVAISLSYLKTLPHDLPEDFFVNHAMGHGFACLQVSDTGQGMTQDVMDKMFDPFYTTKDQGEGTGLGLSLVLGLVRQIGGNVHVMSQQYKGTKIMIYMPLLAQDALTASTDMSDYVPMPDPELQAVGDDKKPINDNSLEGRTIMLVEDEVDLLKLQANLLRDWGATVLVAGNGDEALAIQNSHKGKIDLLLTDIIMPGINGVHLAQLMTSLRQDTDVMFISGYPARDRQLRDIDVPKGMEVLQKPLPPQELQKRVSARLRQVSQ